MSITGEEGGVPVKVGVSIADLTAALYATIATLAALRARERDGRGQLVDISMFESAVSLAVWEAGIYFGSGEVPRAAGSAHKLVVDLEHPILGTLRGLGSPMRLGRTPVRHRRAGPRLGEHSAEVLRELGLGDADMDDLASAGIIARA